MRGLAAVALLGAVLWIVSAAPARAGDVWLWVCHGPNGQPLDNVGERTTPSGAVTRGCASPDQADGLRATAGAWVFEMPFEAPLDRVRIGRTVALSSGQSYSLRAGAPLESGSPLSGEQTFPAAGSQVTFAVSCADVCAPSGEADASFLAFHVNDAVAPAGAVAGWHSPAFATLPLEVSATDVGVGLKSATAFLDGTPVSTAAFGDPGCTDLSPETPTIDLPFGLVNQNDDLLPRITPVGCVGRGTVTLAIDTTTVADALDHTIAVAVSDLAGNTTTVFSQTTEIHNTPRSGSPTATLNIGSDANVNLSADQGAVKGATSGSCLKPQLSMALATKPLRTTKTAVVLAYNRKYRFAGRLTCDVNGVRRSAQKRTTVQLINTPAQTPAKRAAQSVVRIGDKGALSVTLAFKRAGTLTFRYELSKSVRSQVQLKLQVLRSLPRKTDIRATWFRYVVPHAFVRFVSLEALSLPARATVKVTCAGSGCPGSLAHPGPATRTRSTVSLMSGLTGHDLAPGAAIDVTITKTGYQGIGKRYCIRSGQKVKTLPYLVGDRRPSCG